MSNHVAKALILPAFAYTLAVAPYATLAALGVVLLWSYRK